MKINETGGVCVNKEKQKRELLFSITRKDFRVETFRSGGKGGQHQNKTESGVRITHLESGAVGESRDERSQYQNKKKALERLVASPKFQAWHKRKVAEMLYGKTKLEKQVEEDMRDRKSVV